MTAPRRPRLYLYRALYVTALFVLMGTGWLVLAGTQPIRNVGDLSRYGGAMFQVLAPLQLAVMTFFAALGAAATVSLEKDRRTLVLLLLTRLTNAELVLGKLGASLLSVFSMLLAGLPVFLLVTVFGGVSVDQVITAYAVTAATIMAAGAVGCTMALWRDKTFQSLAMTVLTLVLWAALWETLAVATSGAEAGWGSALNEVAESLSPLQAVSAAVFPDVRFPTWWQAPAWRYVAMTSLLSVMVIGLGVTRVRAWNPSREVRQGAEEQEELATIWSMEEASLAGHIEAARSQHVDSTGADRSDVEHRRVWDWPILWREVCTWAYGRKIVLVRIAYLLLALLAWGGVRYAAAPAVEEGAMSLVEMIPPAARVLGPFLLISLVIINSLAVTSITNERDGQSLDLLLATDLSPRDFVLGKLFGVLWVTKEMVLAPLLLVGYLAWTGQISFENMVFVEICLVVLTAFVTMLGIHYGMHYAGSRTAVLVSLGTVFFLFLGVVTCMVIMVSFQGSFQQQLAPFLAFIGGGSIGLYVALGIRNPSAAIALASILLPFATFFAITGFLLGRQELSVFSVITAAYGFTIAALLVPAIYAFDIAMGRTKGGEEEA